jgi:Cu+-exporting ATPase
MVTRLDQSSGKADVVSALRLVPGDRVRVRAGESIPADGVVVEGNALIDESAINSARLPVRKTAGESVLAGTALMGGELLVEVERVGAETAAGTIATTVADVARAFPREPAFQRKAERMAERTVIPTLATAGVGWAAGDLITVGAILHQDWISGPVLAVPLQTMDHLGTALRSGALLRNGTAMQRLAESDFIVPDR